jgi:hypothetical protein
MSGELEAGPSVAKIFTLRERGARVSVNDASLCWESLANSRSGQAFNPLELSRLGPTRLEQRRRLA